jgi:beta-mannanase
MIHLGTSGKRTRVPAISVAQIASGQGDAYLGALNQAVSAWARPIYIRPLAEMNNPGNPWSGDPVAYRKAFARIFVIVHGGAHAGARLAKLHLAPYRGPALAANPLPRVRVLWSALAGGTDPKQYWPGAAYVDVGGADIYKEAGREPPWQKFDALFTFVRAQHRPFAVPEWGMFGVDDPTFVQHMCTFLKQHATETEEFYESKPGSIFDLANKPASRALYRSCITRLAG